MSDFVEQFARGSAYVGVGSRAGRAGGERNRRRCRQRLLGVAEACFAELPQAFDDQITNFLGIVDSVKHSGVKGCVLGARLTCHRSTAPADCTQTSAIPRDRCRGL